MSTPSVIAMATRQVRIPAISVINNFQLSHWVDDIEKRDTGWKSRFFYTPHDLTPQLRKTASEIRYNISYAKNY